ncbi:lipase [Gordonia desulfuricans]|uniref:Lipase n=2 Tax=Gordoniaceae TaxID=85026 RepID=A0A7K3LXS9_9ACTN|nr:lipase [Gordonia sp. NB41Y]NDK92337.1 lipase [Gordonia desulfuricans]
MRTAHCVALIAGLIIALAASVSGATSAGAAPNGTPGGERVVFVLPGQQLLPEPALLDATYGPLEDALRRDGYRVERLDDVQGFDVAADAEVIARAVRPAARSASFVGLVSHSAGGLGGRYFLKFLGGADLVDEYVAIGVPQYGSPSGCSQPVGKGYDTCTDSPLIKRLNEGPDAPGPTRYSVVQSDGEWVDGRLDGTAQCRTYVPVPLSGTGFDHTVEPATPQIADPVRATLRGQCPGQVVTDPVDGFTWKQTVYPDLKAPK